MTTIYLNEDELPDSLTDAEYSEWYPHSIIRDGVRVFPVVLYDTDHEEEMYCLVSGVIDLDDRNLQLTLALRNCRALALRKSKSKNKDVARMADQILRWCSQSGLKVSILRGTVV